MTATRRVFTLALALAPLTAVARQPAGDKPAAPADAPAKPAEPSKGPMTDPTPGTTAAADKQAPPRPGQPKDFRLPRATTETLPNGLRVTLVPYGKVPKAAVELVLDAGNAYEARDQVWLADLTGRLIEQGSRTRSAAEVAEAAARMGGSLDVRVEVDRLTVGGDVLGEFAPDMLRLVADVVRQPRLPESELPRLKADLKRTLSFERAQSQPLAREKFRAALYGDHPYGRLYPTPEQIDAFTLEQVRAFHRAYFGAARAHVYVVGVFDVSAALAAVRAAFGDWERGGDALPPRPAPRSSRVVHLVDRPGAVQATLMVGLPVVDPSHPDWLPLTVTHTLLGGYFSSRITANIREDKGYTYSPASQLSTRRRDAFWVQEADVGTAVTGAALKEILGEIERLRAEPPSEAELERVKSYLTGIFVLRNSSRAAIITQLDFVDVQGLPPDYLDRYVSRVQAVTPQTIRDMARKHLDGGAMTIVVVGDRKVIAEPLAPFGPLRE
jgi:predicted Zn-dependent peptidase